MQFSLHSVTKVKLNAINYKNHSQYVLFFRQKKIASNMEAILFNHLGLFEISTFSITVVSLVNYTGQFRNMLF